MPIITEKDLFESTDPAKNKSEIFNNTVVTGLYSMLRILVLDIFDQKYNEPYFLPQSFKIQNKKMLQKLMKDFDSSMFNKNNKDFLINLFNAYAEFSGVASTRLLLDWMRNAQDSEAHGTAMHLSWLDSSIRRKEITLYSQIPMRLERYFSFKNLLRENFQETEPGWQELGPEWFETPFDLGFYKRQEYDYYGEMENTFDPAYEASSFTDTLIAKIAWENTCQGFPPSEEEMKSISRWVDSHESHWKPERHKMQDLFISPLLKEDYLQRKIIVSS